MTKEEIERLRLLVASATPGPWRCDGVDIFTITDSGKGYPLDRYPDSVDVSLGKCQSCGDRAVGVLRSQDEDFIVAARNEVPALLDEIERLRETLAHSCTCSLADGAAPALRHEATCELRIARIRRLDPALALSRFAAAMDACTEAEVEELKAKLAAMTDARDELYALSHVPERNQEDEWHAAVERAFAVGKERR